MIDFQDLTNQKFLDGLNDSELEILEDKVYDIYRIIKMYRQIKELRDGLK